MLAAEAAVAATVTRIPARSFGARAGDVPDLAAAVALRARTAVERAVATTGGRVLGALAGLVRGEKKLVVSRPELQG